jgi:Holliday junction resolvasome RuvABC DNA-binding subunit
MEKLTAIDGIGTKNAKRIMEAIKWKYVVFTAYKIL